MKSPETLMGTPDYISPEQALGESLDGRSDVYSLAVTLFFLLAGRPPFQADSSITMALMHVHDTPPLLSTIRNDITPQIDRVIAKALAKWPEDRYQTAGKFSEAFAEAVANAGDYVPSESEARRKAIVSNGRAKKAMAPLKPIAQDKSIWKDSSKLRRIALSLVLLLAVIIGSVLSVNIVNKITNTKPHVQSTHVSSPTDYLADMSAWPVEPMGSTYFFQNGQYHIKNIPHQSFTIALYDFGIAQFTNFRLKVKAAELNGVHNYGDYYGIVLRATSNPQHYYLFEITPSGEGQYGFWRFDGKTLKLLKSDTVPSLLSNLGQNNLITIEVEGNKFTFFVNNQQLGKPIFDTSNNPLRSGAIGLSADGTGTEVAFSNLQIDTI
jgi:hypothetical protein